MKGLIASVRFIRNYLDAFGRFQTFARPDSSIVLTRRFRLALTSIRRFLLSSSHPRKSTRSAPIIFGCWEFHYAPDGSLMIATERGRSPSSLSTKHSFSNTSLEKTRLENTSKV